MSDNDKAKVRNGPIRLKSISAIYEREDRQNPDYYYDALYDSTGIDIASAQNSSIKSSGRAPQQSQQAIDNFNWRDCVVTDFFIIKDVDKIMLENGIIEEFYIDLIFQSISDGLIKEGINLENLDKKIDTFSRSITLVRQILKTKKLGTLAGTKEHILYEMAKVVLEDDFDQSSNEEIQPHIRHAARKVLNPDGAEPNNIDEFEDNVKYHADLFKQKHDALLLRVQIVETELLQELSLFLDTVDSLGRFGIPVDTTKIRKDLAKRGWRVAIEA